MSESAVVILIICFLIVLVSVLVILRAGKKTDDNITLQSLRSEMDHLFPATSYRAQLEFMRRRKYAELKDATANDQEIERLSLEYQLIIEEQVRIKHETDSFGAEFDPYVSHQSVERN